MDAPRPNSTPTPLADLQRLTDARGEVMRAESVGPWLETPNSAFGGLKPIEVTWRDESDRLGELVYLLRSGIAS